MKRKLTKSAIFMILIIVFCLLGSILIIFNHYYWSLKGDKIDEYIYHYKVGNKENVPVQIVNENIYYLDEGDGVYTLYKQNIHSKKAKKIGTIEGKNNYCFFYPKYISCSGEKEEYYDYELNLLHSKIYDVDGNAQLIYYQGRNLELKDYKLYENGVLYKELTFNDPDAYYLNNIVIGDNTYIVFKLPNEVTYYYDISTDKYIEQEQSFWDKYNKGFYKLEDDSLITFDLLTKETKKYENITINERSYVNNLKDDKLYFLDEGIIYIIDLNNKLVSKIEHKFESINQIVFDQDYVYLLSFIDGCNVYIIDINNVNKTVMTIDEYQKHMDNLVDERVKKLEDEYHVDIVYKDEAIMKNDTFETTKLNNNYIILESLESVEKVLKKFNVEFFDKFHDDEHKGLIIYLTGKILPNASANTTSNAAGYTVGENNQFEMVVDIKQSGLVSTICHELMHNMENRIQDNFYNEWYKMNPKRFEYTYNYRTYADSKYTRFEDDKNNVYFVDEYSKTYATEDIARVFENICDTEEDSLLLEYPNLYKKAMYLKEKLEREFPSLKNATVFNSLNKNDNATGE